MDFSGAIGKPPAGKLANYITLELPNADIAAAGAEETEIETGISLPQLQGIRWLGSEFEGISNIIADDFIAGTADENIHMDVVFASRTGDHNLDDPEFIEGYQYGCAAMTVSGLASCFAYKNENTAPEGGDVVVTPRIFVRVGNNISATISADAFRIRAGYEFERIGRRDFIELLEKFADIFVI